MDIRRSLGSTGRMEGNALVAWITARLPYTLSRLRSSTGEDTPALIHRLMQTERCRVVQLSGDSVHHGFRCPLEERQWFLGAG